VREGVRRPRGQPTSPLTPALVGAPAAVARRVTTAEDSCPNLRRHKSAPATGRESNRARSAGGEVFGAGKTEQARTPTPWRYKDTYTSLWNRIEPSRGTRQINAASCNPRLKITKPCCFAWWVLLASPGRWKAPATTIIHNYKCTRPGIQPGSTRRNIIQTERTPALKGSRREDMRPRVRQVSPRVGNRREREASAWPVRAIPKSRRSHHERLPRQSSHGYPSEAPRKETPPVAFWRQNKLQSRHGTTHTSDHLTVLCEIHPQRPWFTISGSPIEM